MRTPNKIVLIAMDLDFAELLLNGAGMILEAQALRQDGSLTVIFDPDEEQLARLEHFFRRMDITYYVTSSRRFHS